MRFQDRRLAGHDADILCCRAWRGRQRSVQDQTVECGHDDGGLVSETVEPIIASDLVRKGSSSSTLSLSSITSRIRSLRRASAGSISTPIGSPALERWTGASEENAKPNVCVGVRYRAKPSEQSWLERQKRHTGIEHREFAFNELWYLSVVLAGS